MKITDKHTKNVFIMPKIETKYLNRAKKTELKLLYYIFSHGDSFCVENACRELDETAESVNAALAFWRCAGVIEDETDFEEKNGSEFSGDTAVTAAKAEKPSANDKKNTSAPTDITAKKPSDSYTLAEIASARSENSEFGSLINYLEKHTGHMYNAAEQGIILYLYDTLGIDCELIMGVAQYCISKGKTSPRYIQKTVMNITEQGIKTYAEFDNYLRMQEKRDNYREMVKRIIGAGQRALSKSESSIVDSWENKYGFSEQLISLAYEKTVAKINKPQVAYMSKILINWHENGLQTPEQVNEFFSSQSSSSSLSTASSSDGRLDINLEDYFEKPDLS